MRLELKVSDEAAPVIVELAVLRHWHDQVAGVEFLRCEKRSVSACSSSFTAC